MSQWLESQYQQSQFSSLYYKVVSALITDLEVAEFWAHIKMSN